MIQLVRVIIPARDEEDRIEACLSHVHQALARLPRRVSASVVVVCDGCSDRTASRARRALPSASVLECDHRSVGLARALGVSAALPSSTATRGASGRRAAAARSTWLAFTDADSCVPFYWLARQLAHAERGADAVLGTVVLDREVPAFTRRYRGKLHGASHAHVHGANLGVRMSAYLEAGGVPAWAAHEDRELVRRLERTGARLVWDAACVVQTSARTVGRTPAGVARDLAQLVRRGAT